MPMEYPVPDPLEIEQLSTNSIPATYVIWTDGTTVYADPQDPDLSSFSGDALSVFQDIVDNAPAFGDIDRFAHVLIRRGEYNFSDKLIFPEETVDRKYVFEGLGLAPTHRSPTAHWNPVKLVWDGPPSGYGLDTLARDAASYVGTRPSLTFKNLGCYFNDCSNIATRLTNETVELDGVCLSAYGNTPKVFYQGGGGPPSLPIVWNKVRLGAQTTVDTKFIHNRAEPFRVYDLLYWNNTTNKVILFDVNRYGVQINGYDEFEATGGNISNSYIFGPSERSFNTLRGKFWSAHSGWAGARLYTHTNMAYNEHPLIVVENPVPTTKGYPEMGKIASFDELVDPTCTADYWPRIRFAGPLLSKHGTFLELYDDFTGPSLRAPWTTGGASVAIRADIEGGVVRCTTGTTSGNQANIYSETIFQRDQMPTYESRVKAQQTTYINLVLGFADDVNNFIRLEVNESAGGTANWYARCSSGGTVTETDTGIALDDTDFHKFRIEATRNRVRFFIDDEWITNITSNIPGTRHRVMNQVFTNEAAAKDMDIDYIHTVQERTPFGYAV